jgi:predicted XRE-type DNA-binding protein
MVHKVLRCGSNLPGSAQCEMRAPDHRITDLRRQLAQAITDAVGPRGQHVVAPLYGIPQPRMSELSRGRVAHCSMEWLIRRVHLMGGTVGLTITLGDVAREWRLARYQRKRQPVVPLAPYSLYGRGFDP